MKHEITYEKKCLRCGGINTFIMRSKSVNRNLPDSSVLRIISEHADHPHHVEYCEECDKKTLQIYVGWDI